MYECKSVYRANDYDGLYRVIDIILNRPTDKRKDDEKNTLKQLLCNLDFFRFRKENQKLDLDEISSVIKYERKEPGDVIFRQGDKAAAYFIVLKGIVHVQIPSP